MVKTRRKIENSVSLDEADNNDNNLAMQTNHVLDSSELGSNVLPKSDNGSSVEPKRRGRPKKTFSVDFSNHNHSTPILKEPDKQENSDRSVDGLPKRRGRPRKARFSYSNNFENHHDSIESPSLSTNDVTESTIDVDDSVDGDEEVIEIVVENISSHTVSSTTSLNEVDKMREMKTPEPQPESIHVSESETEDSNSEKPDSPGINIEIMENCVTTDSNSAALSEPMQSTQPDTPVDSVEDMNEDEHAEDVVNIVVFHENESLLSGSGGSEKAKILIGSDSDTDSTVTDLSDYNYKHNNSVTSTRSVPEINEGHLLVEQQELTSPVPKLNPMDPPAVVNELESDLKKIEIKEDESVQPVPSESMEVDSVQNGLTSNQCSESEGEGDGDGENEDLDSRSQESDNDLPPVPAIVVEPDDSTVRRSRRIKKISSKKKRSVGHGLVKDRDCWPNLTDDMKQAEKVVDEQPKKTQAEIDEEIRLQKECDERLKKFIDIKENQYKCDRNVSKEAKRMLCDCFLTQDEIQRGELGCGEDCLNRLLMIECGPKCNVGAQCTNQRFQKMEYSECTVFRTEKKGFGVLAARPIQAGQFIMEYVGEVLDSNQFEKRAADYSKIGNQHYYFMALRSDAIIDATTKGNISRFINHSCDPNSETQKWTVNGELRIGFFSKRYIPAGEELTFDYQFQRYGKEAQKCYCESKNCRGWIGKGPGDSDSEESQVEESEEDEEAEADQEPEESTTEKTPKAPKIPKPRKAPAERKKFKIKIERKKRSYNFRKKNDILHDTDLNEEINALAITGLKNQVHTLKLSRLMVRAEKMSARLKLLELLITGELPCRRLFLDYHGLRILNGWMDSCKDLKCPEELNYRKKILDALAVLPISNKTTLKDSKVLATAQKWSNEFNPDPNPPQPESTVSKENDDEKHEISPNESSNDSKEPSDSKDSKEKVQIETELYADIPNIIKQNEQYIKGLDLNELRNIIGICGKKEDVKDQLLIETEENDLNHIERSLTPPLPPPNKCDKPTFDVPLPVIEQKSDDKSSDEPMVVTETPLPETSPEDSTEVLSEKKIEPSPDDKTEELQEIKMEIETKPNNEVNAPKPETEPVVDQTENKDTDLPPEIIELHKAIFEAVTQLLKSWESLKEIFRIPKKERIEQMKTHEREADLRYQALKRADDEHRSERNRSSSSRYTRDEKREKRLPAPPPEEKLRPYGYEKMPILPHQRHMSKQQRRQMFEMQVAQEESEKVIWNCHVENCAKFGLDPCTTAPADVPAMMNPITGQYYSFDHRPVPTPPSHQYMRIIPPPLPTNPEDYEIPAEAKDLPPLWKYAIDERGCIYYYHTKIRIPQWKPPIKIQPLVVPLPIEASSDSEGSDTTATKDSEEEDLEEKLAILKKCKEKCQLNLDISELPVPVTEPTEGEDGESRPAESVDRLDAHIQAKLKVDMLNNATHFSKAIENIFPNLKRIQRRRAGLVQERPISPRTEDDKLRSKAQLKKYKETKEKLRRRKMETRRQQQQDGGAGPSMNPEEIKSRSGSKPRIVDELDIMTNSEVKKSVYEEWKKQEQKIKLEKKRNAEAAALAAAEESKLAKQRKTNNSGLSGHDERKMKEKFRNDISGIMRQSLTSYMSETCEVGRITSVDDFKHLARKLTHFVMLKEMKHCNYTLKELEVTDSVKMKAREFVKKYMAKFGPVYIKPPDDKEYRE